jgi:hypothetical protein
LISNVSGFTATLALPTEPASRPVILGPDTSVPGHPAWCLLHDRKAGGGVSVCLGETRDVDGGLPGARREFVGASLAQSTGTVPEVHITVNGSDGAIVSVAAAREFAALLADLAAQAEDAGVAR